MNITILSGRLVKDVELKFTPGGIAIAKFTLAVDKELYGDKKQEAIAQGKQTADFLNITVFNKQAEHCANYLSKGSKCLVEGKTVNSNYEKDGKTVYQNSIIANKVEFLDSKSKPTENIEDRFADDDDDIFTAVDDSEDFIPF